MRLVSINVGRSETLSQGDRRATTGICKYPREGPVNVTYGGIAGDAIVDSQHHGGADQALYAYSADDYDWWAQTTGRDFFPGLFGENLTIRDMPSDMRIGDRLLIGAVVLEATAPRIPCGTFSMRMEDSGWGIAFRDAERPGIYFRVLNEGEIEVGDAVTYLENAETDVTAVELFRLKYRRNVDAAELRRFLDAPLAQRMRAEIENKLEALK
jgi:MOSC domain-containing protein YiiM